MKAKHLNRVSTRVLSFRRWSVNEAVKKDEGQSLCNQKLYIALLGKLGEHRF
jgi:hypothetical protein